MILTSISVAISLKPACSCCSSAYISVSSISMPREIEVTWGLVVNGRPVPSELKRMAILDPYQLQGDLPNPRDVGPLETVEERYLVDFKATGDLLWLEDALSIPHKSWKGLQRQIPFLQEIKGLVQVKRDYRGGLARAPRQFQDGKLNDKCQKIK